MKENFVKSNPQNGPQNPPKNVNFGTNGCKWNDGPITNRQESLWGVFAKCKIHFLIKKKSKMKKFGAKHRKEDFDLLGGTSQPLHPPTMYILFISKPDMYPWEESFVGGWLMLLRASPQKQPATVQSTRHGRAQQHAQARRPQRAALWKPELWQQRRGSTGPLPTTPQAPGQTYK